MINLLFLSMYKYLQSKVNNFLITFAHADLNHDLDIQFKSSSLKD